MNVSARVLYLSYSLDDDDAPHQSMGALWLARKGVFVNYLALGNKDKPSWLTDFPNITYRQIPKNHLTSAMSALLVFFFEYKKMKPDFVYVQGAQQTLFVLWLPFVRAKFKLIYHTQDYLEPGKHRFYETCERFFARRADWVICNEPNRARFMAGNYRLRQMPQVIRTALPSWWTIPERDEKYRLELSSKAGTYDVSVPRLIVVGGRYEKDRMSPEVVNAMGELPENYIVIFTGMISGTSSYKECESHLNSVGLLKRALLLRRLKYDELMKLYSACDIGILLYPNDGIGHYYQAPGRLTEYLRCGLQIVTADFPGMELLVLKHNLGTVADPYSPTSIASGIRRIGMQSYENLMEARKRIKAVAFDELSYENQAESVFGQILS